MMMVVMMMTLMMMRMLMLLMMMMIIFLMSTAKSPETTTARSHRAPQPKAETRSQRPAPNSEPTHNSQLHPFLRGDLACAATGVQRVEGSQRIL